MEASIFILFSIWGSLRADRLGKSELIAPVEALVFGYQIVGSSYAYGAHIPIECGWEAPQLLERVRYPSPPFIKKAAGIKRLCACGN
jgi:hypothetical protein